MSDFGVFYTCYKEKEAVEYSLATLFSVYPECPVYLVSDGGHDYSYLESKYPTLKTELEEDTRGYTQVNTDNNQNKIEDVLPQYLDAYRKDGRFILQDIRHLTGENFAQKTIKAVNAFFDRNKRAVDYCKKETILIFEPDVLVRGELNYLPTKENALLGSCVNRGLTDSIKEVMSEIDGAKVVDFWGATPAFYHAETFCKVKDWVSNNQDVLKNLVEADPRFCAYDVFLGVLFAICGSPESVNPEMTECIRNPMWRHTNHPLLHQFREFYPTSSSSDLGRHSRR